MTCFYKGRNMNSECCDPSTKSIHFDFLSSTFYRHIAKQTACEIPNDGVGIFRCSRFGGGALTNVADPMRQAHSADCVVKVHAGFLIPVISIGEGCARRVVLVSRSLQQAGRAGPRKPGLPRIGETAVDPAKLPSNRLRAGAGAYEEGPGGPNGRQSGISLLSGG